MTSSTGVRTRRLPTAHEETFTYDLVGNKLTESDANEKVSAFEYDGLNRLKLMTDPEGNQVQFDYDESGNRRSKKTSPGASRRTWNTASSTGPAVRTVSSAVDGFTYETPSSSTTTWPTV